MLAAVVLATWAVLALRLHAQCPCKGFPFVYIHAIKHNNLGGHGPDHGDEGMVFRGLLRTGRSKKKRDDDVDVVMKVNAVSEYKPWSPKRNGLPAAAEDVPKVVAVNIHGGTSVKINVTLHNAHTLELLTLPKLALSFFDLDLDRDCIESVTAHDYQRHVMSDLSDISLKKDKDGNGATFTATSFGSGKDTLSTLSHLPHNQTKRTVTLYYQPMTVMQFTLHGSYGKTCHLNPRVFEFAARPILPCAESYGSCPECTQVPLDFCKVPVKTCPAPPEPGWFPWWLVWLLSAIVALLLFLLMLCLCCRRSPPKKQVAYEILKSFGHSQGKHGYFDARLIQPLAQSQVQARVDPGGCKVFVILEKADLEIALSPASSDTLTEELDHDLVSTHECLLALLDSPLNKAGKLTVYVHSASNKLIEVNPALRVPRHLGNFAATMKELFKEGKVEAHGASGEHDSLMRLLPAETLVETVLPKNCKRYGIALGGELKRVRTIAEDDTASSESVVFVIGVPDGNALKENAFGARYITDTIAVCKWDLRPRQSCSMLVDEWAEAWNI